MNFRSGVQASLGDAESFATTSQPLKRLAKFNRRFATRNLSPRLPQPLKRLAKFSRRYATNAVGNPYWQ